MPAVVEWGEGGDQGGVEEPDNTEIAHSLLEYFLLSPCGLYSVLKKDTKPRSLLEVNQAF